MNTMKYAYSLIATLCLWVYAAVTLEYNDLLDIPMGMYALILALMIVAAHFLAVRRYGKPGDNYTNGNIAMVFFATIGGLILAATLSYLTSTLLGNG